MRRTRPITGVDIREFMRAGDHAEFFVPHAFFSRTRSFELDLPNAAHFIVPWISAIAAQERTEWPLSELKIAQQCGGSDASSGITANPLAGAVAEEVIRHGHTAEGNPSGGNVNRGSYKIVRKSVGAAPKLGRHVRLDHVIDHGEPLPGPGRTFMDSPGTST